MWNLNNLLNNIFNLVYSNNLLKNYLIKKGKKVLFLIFILKIFYLFNKFNYFIVWL